MQISCPKCSKMLEAPYPLPTMAQCPFCANVFAPMAPLPAAPPIPPPPGPQPPIPTTDYSITVALNAVRGPAIALIAAGGLNLLWAVIDLGYRMILFIRIQNGQPLPPMPPPFQNIVLEQAHVVGGVALDLFWALAGILVIYGAVKMQRLESFGLAVTSSILSLVPCVTCCCCLGIPFGVWALVVLNRSEVRSSFR